MTRELQSWGRFPRATRQSARPIVWQTDRLPADGGPLLPYGQGRSYGDSCLNEGGTLLTTGTLDRLLGFDAATGVVRCEAGVTLDTLLRLVAPRGWFLPVSPGTKFVSVGGAIANDIHGKNHHRAGTFGRYVRRFELLRSDGSRRVCSPEEHPDWYEATIGGLGLTGLILWAEVQLRSIHNPFVLSEAVPVEDLDGFFRVSRESEADHEFTVAWIDSLARGRQVGRGVFFRGNFAPPQLDGLPLVKSHLSHGSALAVPFDMPGFSLNRLSVAAFNWLYRRMQLRHEGPRLQHYDPFFYPLDGVHRWNRIYGRRGFLQFQCVVPHATARDALREILERSAREVPSFLTVLKTFGDVPSPGWLSFPRPGATLALDFANRGERTWRLVAELDRVTREAGGAVYPAKDSRMSSESFAAYFPKLERFKPYVDPAFSSSFWRRVTGAPSEQLSPLPLGETRGEGASLPATTLSTSL
jgi:FAD/FMN-containing dehydrogenase